MRKDNIKRTIKNIVFTLLVPISVWIIMELLCYFVKGNHVLASRLDIMNYVRSSCISGCVAIALSFNLGNGRFDLSLGAQRLVAITLAGLIGIRLGLQGGWVIAFAIVIGLILGFIVGLVFVITRIPAMVLGIGMSLIYECISFVASKSEGLQLVSHPGIVSVLSNVWVCIGVVVAAMAITTIIDRYTKFGYFTRAIAGSQVISHNSGINVFKHAVGCYTIAGGMVAISGAFDAGLKGSVDASMGMASNVPIMTNTFPMFLGRFISKWSSVPIGIIVGTFTVQMFKTGLQILSFSETMIKVFALAAFLLFLIFTANKDVFKKRGAKKARIAEAKAEKIRLGYAQGDLS